MFNNNEGKNDYKCSYCGRFVLKSFQFIHDVRCESQKKMFDEIDTFIYKCKICGIIFMDISDANRMEHLLSHQSKKNEDI